MPAAAAGLDRGAALLLTLGAADELIAAWSVAKAARAGAAAVHLSLAWPAAGEGAVEAVGMVAEEAAKFELPLLLELSGEIEPALAALAEADIECDLLALPAAVDNPPAPWLLGGGEEPEAWLTAVRQACEAGACGFLGGPLLPSAESDAAERWLLDEGVYHLRRAVTTAERGRAWFEHPRCQGWLSLDETPGWHEAY
jgi:hypothetical protein